MLDLDDINTIKKDLRRAILDEHHDAYQKLQTLFEYIITDYLKCNDKEETKNYSRLMQITTKYPNRKKILHIFRQVNGYANDIKHVTNRKIPKYDKNLVKDTLIEFDKLNKFLYNASPDGNILYRVDNIIELLDSPNRYKENNNPNLQNELEKKLKQEKQEFNKQIIKYETQLNLYSNEIKKLRQEKQANNNFNGKLKFEIQLKEYETQLNLYKSEIKKLKINNSIQQKRLQKELQQKQQENNTQENFVINIGTSPTDYGFIVKNITSSRKCTHESASIYATIFNFLQRAKIIKKDIFIEEYEKNNNIKVNYGKVYRFEMAILLLIKNNLYNSNTLNICSNDGYNSELDCAIYHINTHYQKISQLIKNDKYIQININNTNNDAYNINIYKNNYTNISIATSNKNIIIIDNNENEIESNNNIWFENNIIYNIDENIDKNILEQYLNIFFGFSLFKEGQIESIIDILNEDKDKIIIMPTGSGKSLIYHFVALLQPSPSLIISPTDILIKDQVRNLHELKHKIDDVKAYYQNAEDNEIVLDNKLVYVTPRILQQLESIHNFIDLDVDYKIANIFLDEVHTISNWSHNFKPDYLMMSFNLRTFLRNTRWIGFTATANARVQKDLSLQLNIPSEHIHIPIALKRTNITYKFEAYEKDDDFINSVNKTGNDTILNNLEKMLIFTKSSKTNQDVFKQISNLTEELKYDIDVLKESDEHSYIGFVKGRKCILLAESDIGIGINIPAVNKIMHYGIPTSKSQFVQEIGRAGRNGQDSTSIITYVPKKHMPQEDLTLLNLNTSVDKILDIISNSTSDISLSLRKIMGNIKHYSIRAKNIKDLYSVIINNSQDTSTTLTCPKNDEDNHNIDEYSMYFLVKMGIIHNWYIKSQTTDEINYLIEICPDLTVPTIKKKTIEYISTFGNSKEIIFNIENSSSVNDIIYHLQNWYYNEFILIHRENLSNMLDFIEKSNNNNYSQEKIESELSRYFSAKPTNIEEDAFKYIQLLKITNDEQFNENNKFFKILSELPANNNSLEKMIEMEKYLEIKYDVIADLYIYVYNLLIDHINNISRFERILINLPNEDSKQFLHFTSSLYKGIKEDDEKSLFLQILNKYYKIEDIITTIFEKNNKDISYYKLMTKYINKKMKGIVYNE